MNRTVGNITLIRSKVSQLTTSCSLSKRSYATNNNNGSKKDNGTNKKETSTSNTNSGTSKPKTQYINKSTQSMTNTPPPPPPTSTPSNNDEKKQLFTPITTQTSQASVKFGRLQLTEEDKPATKQMTPEARKKMLELEAIAFDRAEKYLGLSEREDTREEINDKYSLVDKMMNYDPNSPDNLKVQAEYKAPTPAEAIEQVITSFSESLDRDINEKFKDGEFEREDLTSVPMTAAAKRSQALKLERDAAMGKKDKTIDEQIEEKIFNSNRRVYQADNYEKAREETEELYVVEKKLDDSQLPYHQQSKSIETLLRMHLNKFLVKVHPDLYHGEPEKYSANQRSLTALNNLLRTRDAYIAIAEGTTSDTKVDRIPSSISTEFHFSRIDGSEAIIEHEMVFEEPRPEVSTSKSALVEYVTELRFAVHRQLYDLFIKSEIPIPPAELEQLARPAAKLDQAIEDPWDDFFGLSNSKDGFSLSHMLDDFLSDVNVSERRKLSEVTLEHETLLQMFNEDKVFFYYGENMKGDMNVMRQLGQGEEAERQIIHIKKYLTALEFKSWNNLPIMVTTPQYYESMIKLTQGRGFVVLLKDFVPEETLSYVKQQIPSILSNFNQLYSISKRNQELLQNATIDLEKSLGASSIILENLFSINQRTMNQVRDKFNQSQTVVAKLNVPMSKLIGSTKAAKWLTLPQSKLDANVIDEWKIKNIDMSSAEKAKIVKRINRAKRESRKMEEDEEELQEMVDRDLKDLSLKKTDTDRLSRPLVIVDSNKFNFVQSAPFVAQAMSCVERLTKLVNQPIEVPMVMPQKMLDPNHFSKVAMGSQDGQGSGDRDAEYRQYYELLMGNAEMTVDKLADRKSLSQIDTSNINIHAKVVSSFDVPTFGQQHNQSDADSSDASAQNSSFLANNAQETAQRIVNSMKNRNPKDTSQAGSQLQQATIVRPKQTLSDFGWANIHLIVSDHYNFIISKENDVAYVFIPLNFREEELFLFLNANYDKIQLVQNLFYSPVLQKTQQVMQVQAIQSVVSQIRTHAPFASIKIDNMTLASPTLQYQAVQSLKNVIYLSTDTAAIETVAPYIDLVIGSDSRIVFKNNDTRDKVTIVVSHLNRASMNMSKIIGQLVEQSAFFKKLLPNFTYQPFDLSNLQQVQPHNSSNQQPSN